MGINKNGCYKRTGCHFKNIMLPSFEVFVYILPVSPCFSQLFLFSLDYSSFLFPQIQTPSVCKNPVSYSLSEILSSRTLSKFLNRSMLYIVNNFLLRECKHDIMYVLEKNFTNHCTAYAQPIHCQLTKGDTVPKYNETVTFLRIDFTTTDLG